MPDGKGWDGDVTRPEAEGPVRDGQPISPRREQLSLRPFATVLLRHRRLILYSALTLFVVVVVPMSFTARTYNSSASFMPQASSQRSGLSALAAQFGVPATVATASESPAFYADLLGTREVLQAVLESQYRVPTDTGVASGNLMDFLKVRATSEALRIEKALRRLQSLLSVDLQTRTGVVRFSVRAPNRVLAQQVAQRLLDEVNRFNLEQRQSQASAERRFTEGRLQALQTELRAAEDRLQAFLQHNRDFRSPELTFEQGRLARDVELRQAVYTTVAQANEQARINEVRDTPVITVIDPPSLPSQPEGRGRTKGGALALILGGLAGLVMAYGKEFAQHARSEGHADELSSLARETVADLRRPWGWMLQRLWRRSKVQAG